MAATRGHTLCTSGMSNFMTLPVVSISTEVTPPWASHRAAGQVTGQLSESRGS